ncbi:MAG: 2Fe-2S iron-sulfur cluster-binding protein [Campylobacterota bacterium]|nr:2Fe-2S iron-sulfur cluster-binding protein [Campylobacterota bacterium]
MKIKIKRETFVQYEVDLKDATLLEVLNHIKTTQDASLTFASGCRSSVCGSCSMRVNGREVLACSYKVQDGDEISPLKNVPLIRDLVVDMNKAYKFNQISKAWLSQKANNIALSQENEKINEIQSDCILCGSCYSACPVYTINGEFKGPFSLTRVWKYVSDKRENNEKEKIDTIQNNGIWDCTLCNECSMVCPQNISSKSDIEKLRMKSSLHGYIDPNFASFSGRLSF